jgi:hypothetical protein
MKGTEPDRIHNIEEEDYNYVLKLSINPSCSGIDPDPGGQK